MLHEVNELENSESLLHAVCHWQLVVVLVSEHIMSMLHFQLLDMPLLKKLPKVKEGMISLRHVVAVLLVESNRCHYELLMRFKSYLLSKLVKSEEPISVVRVVDHLGGGHATKFNDL